jgi:hypothetical protein
MFISGGAASRFSDENTRASSNEWLKSVDKKANKPHHMASLLKAAAVFQKACRRPRVGDVMDGIRETCVDASSPAPAASEPEYESEGEQTSESERATSIDLCYIR